MEQQQLSEYLAGHNLLEGLDEEYIDMIAGLATEKRYGTQETVFSRDAAAEEFYIVKEGKVLVEIPSLFGAPVIIQPVAEGQVLGWSWLVPPYRWHFEAVAEVPSTLIVVDGVALREKCEQDNRLGFQLLKRFSRLMMDRLENARRQVIDSYDGG